MLARFRTLIPFLPSRATWIASVLYAAAMPPWDLSPLAFFALVPWLLQLHQAKDLKAAWREGFWMCFITWVLGAFWVAPTLNHFAQVPWPLAILGLLLAGLFHELQFQVFAIIAFLARTRLRIVATHWSGMLFLAAAFTGLDFISPKIFENVMGHTQHNAPWIRIWASIGGVPLISFGLALFNLALFALIHELRTHTLRALARKRALLVAFPALFLCFALGGGYLLQEQHPPTPSTGRTIRAAVIQANIGDFDKVAAITGKYAAGEKIIQTYLEASSEAMRADPKPDVIVWPETAYPSTFRKPMVAVELERDQMVERWVRTHRVPIWFGAYDRTETYDYNSLFFLSPPDTDEHDLQTYHKTILLPFGEYIPIVGDIKWIRDRFPQVGFFGKGPGPTAYPVQVGEGERLRVHPIICYEALYPEFTRKGAQAGADLILNITNDSWFGTFGEPQMHFALAKFRSIETGLPQLRATNTGITALVLPDGSLENVGEIGKAQVLHYTVPLQNRPTFFLRIGDLLGWLCVFGPLAVLLGRGIRVTRSPRSRG